MIGAVVLNEAFADARRLLDDLFEGEIAKRPLWPAPYNVLTVEAAYAWLTECWWTFNEADNGAVELIPKEDFVLEFCREWVEAYTSRTPLVTEKSRRLLISWASRGLETWVSGLSRCDGLIIDQTYKGSGEHLWRVHFSLTELYDRRPELNLRRHQFRGSEVEKELTVVRLANGSRIEASYQDAGAAQGKGKTWITLEELSKYRAPAEFFAQARLVTMGAAAGLGGWVNAIANATPNPEWHALKKIGTNPDGTPLHQRAIDLLKDLAAWVMEGMAARLLPSGVRYLVIHYTADSGKRGLWGRLMRVGVPERQWEREMELREDTYEGKPVFEMYDDAKHAPEAFRGAKRLAPNRGSQFVCGWDGGNTMRPAAVLLEITAFPHQVRVLLEVTSKGNEPMSVFAPRVMAALKSRLPFAWAAVAHVGDATINHRQGNNGESAGDVAKRTLGRKPKAMSNNLQVRQSAVTDLLMGQVKGEDDFPLFVIDVGACPMIHEGFMGAYRYETVKNVSDGAIRYKPEPEKNEWADPADALQYAAQQANKILKRLGVM